MPDEQHMQWLLEGVKAWNERRRTAPFKPNLTGLFVLGKFQDNGQEPDLAGIDLEDAELEGCDFSKVVLNGASFVRSNLKDANFSESSLNDTDLSDANLDGSILQYAKIRSAKFDRSSMVRAFLVGSEIYGSSFVDAKLTYAHLEGDGTIGQYAHFERADLTDAHLQSADFRCAHFEQAKMESADLRWAKLNHSFLNGAYLNRAKLNGANLSFARLENARLEFANIEYANLVGTMLFGADLQKVQLWKNVLYDKDSSPKQYSTAFLPDSSVESIDELLNVIRRVKALYEGHHEDVQLFFRGEYSTRWELVPSVMRDTESSGREGATIIELLSRCPEDFSSAESALAEWVIAQHFGLKTRFLDLTKNPLVALFNSCFDNDGELQMENGRFHIFAVPRHLIKPFNSDTVSVIANFAKLTEYEQEVILGKSQVTFESLSTNEHPEAHMYPEIMLRLYQYIRQEKPYFRERINHRDFFRVFVIEPQQITERIRSQSGAFLVSAFHKKLDRVNVRSWNDRIPIYANYRLVVPKRSKPQLAEDLRLLNITRETLFPGLESTTKAISNRFQSPNNDFAI